MATPAAPAPAMTTRRSAIFLSTILSAFSSAASVTTAVPCWSSWKTGMSSSSSQPLLDLEAGRRGDVLEVDAAEGRGDAHDGLDDLLGARSTFEADREGVDAGELLEQQRLALHDRHGGLGADVAEAEHRGAVGDDGDGVLLDRELVGLRSGPRRWRCRPGPRPACRPSTGRRGRRRATSESTSILPPSCMAKVRSSQLEQLDALEPLDGVDAPAAGGPRCVQLTMTSSSRMRPWPRSPRARRCCRRRRRWLPRACPACRGRLSRRTRSRMEKAAVGVSAMARR